MAAPTAAAASTGAASAASSPAAAAGSAVAASSAAAAASAASASSASSRPAKKGRKRKTAESLLRHSISIALICQSNLNRSMEAHWVLQERGNIRSYSFGAGSKVRLPGETMDRPHVYEFGTPYDTMFKDLERKNRARYTKNGMLQMLDRDRQLKLAPERWQDHYSYYQNPHAKRLKAPGVSADAADDADSVPRPPHFDIVITYEKRVFDIVLADIEARGADPTLSQNLPTHLLNIDTTDNHAEAAVSADLTLKLIKQIYGDTDEGDEKARQEEKTGEEDNGEGDDDGDAEDEEDAAAEESEWVDKIDDIIDKFETKHGKEVSHTVLFY